MSQISPRTAGLLHQAGFPQPAELRFGQLWYYHDGPMLILGQKDGMVVFAKNPLKGEEGPVAINAIEADIFTKEVSWPAVYAPTATDIMLQMHEPCLQRFISQRIEPGGDMIDVELWRVPEHGKGPNAYLSEYSEEALAMDWLKGNRKQA